MASVDLVFPAPTNQTSFFDMMGYFNSLTDVGAGSMFWTVILIVISSMIFLMMKAYSVEKSAGITFIVAAVLAFFLRILGWVNDYVLTVTIILAIFGIFLLVRESSQYE
jgi:Mg2+/Co2+ transporter CorB